MQARVSVKPELGPLWEAHRETVRRFLISLGRDFDLAEDLLQETYLRAQAGFAGYRGGDPAAWLLVIAKNVFRGHLRQGYVRRELPLEDVAEEAAPAHDVLDLLAVRQAVRDLPPLLRTTLVMKHYAGFTYDEIAARLRCPAGTAKWRVNEALGRLRAALPPERSLTMGQGCETYREQLVDFVYGLLPEAEAARVKRHVKQCPACQAEVAELRRTTSLLDTLEGNWRMMHLVEVDREGAMTLYSAFSFVNTGDTPLGHTWFDSEKNLPVSAVLQDGAEVSFEKRQSERCKTRFTYDLTLPRPVPPGQRVSVMVASPPTTGNAQKTGENQWRLGWAETPGEPDIAYVQVIRLPAGATVLSTSAKVANYPRDAAPSARETQPPQVMQNHAPTLTWREVLSETEQFECTVEYRLE